MLPEGEHLLPPGSGGVGCCGCPERTPAVARGARSDRPSPDGTVKVVNYGNSSLSEKEVTSSTGEGPPPSSGQDRASPAMTFGGSPAHPLTDPEREARLSMKYAQMLREWQALPWWKRWLKRLFQGYPQPPTEV